VHALESDREIIARRFTELLRGFMVNASSGSWTFVNKTGY
jgi:hypothetical protein